MNQAAYTDRVERKMDRLRAKSRAEVEHAKEHMPAALAEANALLEGFGSKHRFSAGDNGALILQVEGQPPVFEERPTLEVMAQGALLQGAQAHLANLARSCPASLEARLIDAIAGALPVSMSRSRSDAPRVASLLIRKFWMLSEDDGLPMAAVVASTVPATGRAKASALVASARGGKGKANKRRQDLAQRAVVGTPALVALTRLPRNAATLLGRGHEPLDLIKQLGGGVEVAGLSASAATAIDRATVHDVERWASMLRAAGTPISNNPTKARRLVQEMRILSALRATDAHAMFILKHRRDRIEQGVTAEALPIHELYGYMIATDGRRGGWTSSMNMDAALGHALMERASMAAAIAVSDDSPLRQPAFTARLDGLNMEVAPARSTADLVTWGVGLDVYSLCALKPLPRILRRSSVVVGVFKLVRHRDSIERALVSVAEIGVPGGILISHVGRLNGAPPAKASAAITAYVSGQWLAGEQR